MRPTETARDLRKRLACKGRLSCSERSVKKNIAPSFGRLDDFLDRLTVLRGKVAVEIPRKDILLFGLLVEPPLKRLVIRTVHIAADGTEIEVPTVIEQSILAKRTGRGHRLRDLGVRPVQSHA